MRTGLKGVVAAASAATLALGVAAVWLSGDARAFGVVIMVAGGVASGVIGRNEWRAQDLHRQPVDAEQRSARATELTKAA